VDFGKKKVGRCNVGKSPSLSKALKVHKILSGSRGGVSAVPRKGERKKGRERRRLLRSQLKKFSIDETTFLFIKPTGPEKLKYLVREAKMSGASDRAGRDKKSDGL